ncbi:S9 family peptidase [Kocuria sp. U4B]
MDDTFAQPAAFVAVPRITGLSAHRNGTVVATVQSLTADGSEYRTHAVALEAGPVPLTRGEHSVGSLVPGPAGELYFTADRPTGDPDDDARARLWVLPPRGEARLLLARSGGIGELAVAGDRLFFTGGVLPSAADEAEHERLAAARRKGRASGILHESFPVRHWDEDLGPEEPAVFVAELAGATADGSRLAPRRLPLPPGRLTEYTAAPDGSLVLVALETLRHGTEQSSDVWAVPVDGGEARRVGASTARYEYLTGPVSPSGTRALLARWQHWLEGQSSDAALDVVDLTTGQVTPLVPGWDGWPLDPVWLDDDTVAFCADHRGRGAVHLGAVGAAGPRLLAGGDEDPEPWSYAGLAVADGGLVALRSRVDRAPEPVRIDPAGGGVRPLARPVPAPEPAGRLEEVHAVAEDGTPVRAWLALPPEPAPGGHPLLVFVHGGPWASTNAWSWRWNPWLFTARGYAVLLPDPAISTGYGQAMIDRGQQELGGTPFTDVLALTGAAEAREDVDAGRTALLGGSYGGYMANWTAGHTGTRFRCIVTHASLWNLGTMGTTTDNGEWHRAVAPRQAAEYSPHRFAGRIEVPVLVIHGDKDYRVPIGQAQELWHALRRYAPSGGHRFLYFPDEGHWILKPQNVRTWYETVLAFCDEHVLGRPWTRPEALG